MTDVVARRLLVRYLGTTPISWPVRAMLLATLLLATVLAGAAVAAWRIAADFDNLLPW